jgi:two-component system sensor histidine kinase CpxA
MRWSLINPFNSLFGRIFLWFWSALLLILLSAFFLAKQLTNLVEVNAVSEKQSIEAQAVVQILNNVGQRRGNIQQALRRIAQRTGQQLVAINVTSDKLLLSFPAPLGGNVDELRRFVDSDTPLLIRLNNMEFVGPFQLNSQQTEYKLYVGRLLLRSERGGMPRSRVAIAGLVLAILLSTLFCFGLVLSITRPLGALRSASNKIAKGNLSARIEGFETRKDEVGNLAHDFNTMAARLQNLVDSQKQLMANVSHELRTPLTRLQLAVALLEDELNTKTNEAAGSAGANNRHLVRIESEISKMDQMIGQVLTIAKINTSQQPINLQRIPLAALLQDLLHDAKFEAEALHKKLRVQAIPDAYIKADSLLLVSAIENIIRNAIRFAKSEVVCEFFLDEAEHDAKQQKVRAKSWLRCIISDDGDGMPAQEIEKIFDPFFRGKHQVQEASKGAGLGLAIAAAAIKLHGGTICALARGSQEAVNAASLKTHLQESSPLNGLSVIISLPIEDEIK